MDIFPFSPILFLLCPIVPPLCPKSMVNRLYAEDIRRNTAARRDLVALFMVSTPGKESPSCQAHSPPQAAAKPRVSASR